MPPPQNTMKWLDKKLAICVTANQENINTNFTWSLLNMYKPRSFCILHEGQHIKSNSLNRLVERGMDFGADKFLFLDVDMEFPSNTIAQLLTHDLDIVSGLYHIKVWPYSPVAGLIAKNNHRVNARGKHWKEDYAPLPENQLVEIGWAGIGCLMVDRKVFDTIPLPCFRDIWDKKRGQRKKGHDILFCETAKKYGFKVYIDTSIDCTHRHSIGINKLWVEAYHESGMEQIMRDKLQKWSSEPAWWDEKWTEVAIKRREQIHTPEVNYIVDHVPKESSVCDIGCGSGYALHRLKKERDCKGYGYDFSKIAIEVLATRGLQGEVCDVRTFNPNGASYHTVICSHLIEHVDDEYEEQLIRTVANMAEKQAFISVPFEDKLWIEHKRLYTEKTLTKLLKPYFADVRVITLGDGILAHCIVDENEKDSVIVTDQVTEDRQNPENPSYWDSKVDYFKRNNEVVGRLDVADRIADRIPEGATVGDFGCGYSSLLSALRKKRDCKCYAYDFSPRSIALMKEVFNIDGEVADILTFNPNGTKHHTMILSHVLEHFDGDNVDKVLDVISKMSEEQAIIVVPQEIPEGIDELSREVLGKEHKCIYTVDSLREVLSKHFDSVEIETIKPKEEDADKWVFRHIIGIAKHKQSGESDEVQPDNRVSVGAEQS